MDDCPPLQEDIQLVLQAGMWELWLIDRAHGATDQTHQLFATSGKSEEILRHIAAGKAIVLPTTTISILQWSECQALPLDPRETYVLQVALDLGVLGGHYAAYYVTPTVVEVFDSMVGVKNSGVYTSVFEGIATLLFPNRRLFTVKPNPGEATLQPTGGFLWILPSFSMSTACVKDRKILQLCNHEAQDHFCWAWGLFYLHSRLEGLSLNSTRKWLADTDYPPLALIKSYLWLLMSWFDDRISPELQEDFLSIWDAEDRTKPSDYRRYFIYMDPVHLTSVSQCLTLLLPPLNVQLVRQEQREVVPMQCRS